MATVVLLFFAGPLNEAMGNDLVFPVVMAAVVAALDDHSDLMRMAIASPGVDFRLGAVEAPPAIMSTYFGEDLTSYLTVFRDGEAGAYVLGKKDLDIGVKDVLSVKVPTEDCNHSSSFPYGRAGFKFRAAGSSQNVSIINTVLDTSSRR